MSSIAYSQFQSIQGPTDSRLQHTTLDGYQPVSRIGEVVINAFVDAYEHANLPQQLKAGAIDGLGGGNEVEYKPHFHEWASVMPGMICVSRKARNATFRNYVAAETATPVIGCAACIPTADAKQYYVSSSVAALAPHTLKLTRLCARSVRRRVPIKDRATD